MSRLPKDRIDHAAKIREIGSRIRFLGLDKDGDSPQHDADAAALVDAHSEEDLAEGLEFAAYLASMATPGCQWCGGLGAKKEYPARCRCGGRTVVDGHPAHVGGCDGIARDRYEPCACAQQNEQARNRAASMAAPAARVRSTREADLARRIAEAKKVLATALARQAEAVAPAEAEIAKAKKAVEATMAKRQVHEKHVLDAAQDVRDEEQKVVDLREQLRAAEARLRDVQAWHGRTKELVAGFDAEHAPLTAAVADLEATRDRIARHHEPKVDKARRALRRLTYLRGDKPSDEVTAVFAKEGEGGA